MNLKQSVLVGASGRAMFGVGGENAYRTHSYKGYAVSLEWDESDGEPILLMWPEISGRETGVFGICLSSAGKYADPSGRPTEDGIVHCAAALPTLGRAMLDIEVKTLVDVVMRFIPDLLMMPPAPRAIRLQARGGPVLDIEQRDGRGRKITEASV
jgi:hypothetical protein